MVFKWIADNLPDEGVVTDAYDNLRCNESIFNICIADVGSGT